MDFDRQLAQVADTYRDQGYSVTLRPSPDELPPFARDFRVEILARRGAESVLCAVRKDRDALAADGDMQRYAEITGAQPGWRFDFAVVEPEHPRERDIRGATEFSRDDVIRSLEQAEQLNRVGFSRYAVVAAWAALEAAMRMRLRAGGQEAGWGSMPRQMAKELFSAGVLTPDEFQRIDLASQLRNQIVHGFSPQPAGSETHQVEVAQSLSDIARRLVSESWPERRAV